MVALVMYTLLATQGEKERVCARVLEPVLGLPRNTRKFRHETRTTATTTTTATTPTAAKTSTTATTAAATTTG